MSPTTSRRSVNLRLQAARIGAAILVTLPLIGCTVLPMGEYSPPTAVVDRPGGGIVAYRCAACHAVQGPGPGRNRLAPTFRDLGRRYDPATLAAVLQEISTQGHGQMPPYQFSPAEVEVLVVYIRSVR